MKKKKRCKHDWDMEIREGTFFNNSVICLFRCSRCEEKEYYPNMTSFMNNMFKEVYGDDLKYIIPTGRFIKK